MTATTARKLNTPTRKGSVTIRERLAKWKWEADVIERSEPVSISGVQVRVPRTRDLILLKLAAGGYADLQDAAALLAVGDADTVIPDVEAHIRDVRPDVRAL
jgi:hypothetical protein